MLRQAVRSLSTSSNAKVAVIGAAGGVSFFFSTPLFFLDINVVTKKIDWSTNVFVDQNESSSY